MPRLQANPWIGGGGGIPAGDQFTLQLLFPVAPDITHIRATQVPGYTVSAPLYTASDPSGGELIHVPLTATAQQSVDEATATLSATARQVGATAAAIVATPGVVLSAGAAAVGAALQSTAKAVVGPAVAILVAVVLVALVVLRR